MGRSKHNAVAHGLRSVPPVLPKEDPAEWQAFRAGVVADFAPAGVLEAEQVNLIAGLMWRRRRVVGFEVTLATCPPDADSDQPPRLGRVDPHPF